MQKPGVRFTQPCDQVAHNDSVRTSECQEELNMSFANEARGRLTEARNVLIDRRRQANDAKERAAIDDAIRELNENLGFINQAALLDAATIVVDATKALEAVVRSARLSPFDFDMKDLERTIEKIAGLLRNGEVGEHFERAPEPVVATPTTPGPAGATPVSPVSVSTPATHSSTTETAGGISPPNTASPTRTATGSISPQTPGSPTPEAPDTVSAPTITSPALAPGSSVSTLPKSAGPATTPAGNLTAPVTPEPPGTAPRVSGAALPPIGTSLNFTALRSELDAWFNAVIVRDECKDKVQWNTKQLLENQSRYRGVGLRVNHMPWAMVGVIHAMECCFNFAGHLHNGDPLTNRTKHVPAGQPQAGTPPYSWENSAIDALTGAGFNSVTDWSVPHMLFLLEKYNGFGYRKMGKPTPYLWSLSNLHEKGKYVADGHFDPEAVSKQCGAAVMLKALIDRGTDLSS
jgi:lysozyme family protein